MRVVLAARRPERVTQSRNAAGTCNRDAGIFLSLEDAGEAEDVRGLHEEAADDSRAQRPLRGPNARRRRGQGFHRRTGRMIALTLSPYICVYIHIYGVLCS